MRYKLENNVWIPLSGKILVDGEWLGVSRGESVNNPTDPPTDPTDPPPSGLLPATGVFSYGSDQERAEIRKRVGLDPGGTIMYKTRGDVQTNSPNDWERVLARANNLVNAYNSAKSNGQLSSTNYNDPYNLPYKGVDRYRNYYTGSGAYPTSSSIGTDAAAYYEPRKNANPSFGDTSADCMASCAFIYWVTGTPIYAEATKYELLWYARNPQLDFSNTTRFVIGSAGWADGNPGFFIMEWTHKCLVAYEFIENSSLWTLQEKSEMQTWFLKIANYARGHINYRVGLVFPSRASNNYTSSSSWDLDPYDGSTRREARLHRGSVLIKGVSTMFNNRIIAWAKSFFAISAKYNDASLISDGIKYWKEFIAFGTWGGDCTVTEFYRGKDLEPEKGHHYASIVVDFLSLCADIYARRHSNILYEWEMSQDEYNMFYGHGISSNYYWATTGGIPAVGKSLKKVITAWLKYFDKTYGNTRQWLRPANGSYASELENVDGWSLTYPTYSNGSDSVRDTWMSRPNLYYRDQYFEDVYTRRILGQRTYVVESPVGSWYTSWDGFTASDPAMLLRYGKMIQFPYDVYKYD